MHYFNESGAEIFDPDYAKGYGVPDRLLIAHHDAELEVKEVGHYEVVQEYPNGGKDVEWVVDIPGVPAKDAWDEYENIMRWHWYTEEELAEMNKPSQLDVIEAQVLYTALMTGTILEV